MICRLSVNFLCLLFVALLTGCGEAEVATTSASGDGEKAISEPEPEPEPEPTYTYVVPETIEKLPPNTFVPSQRDFVKELLAVGFRRKTQFETTESFLDEMETLYDSATIFGQPSTNRFLLLAGFIPAHRDPASGQYIFYDADSDTVKLNIDSVYDSWGTVEYGHPPSGLSQLADVEYENLKHSESIAHVKWLNCPKQGVRSNGFDCEFTLRPALAEEILSVTPVQDIPVKPLRSGLQAAFVISIGLDRDSSFSTLPLKAAEHVVADNIVNYEFDLYPTVLHEIIVFRPDTGEILTRTGHTDND